MLPKRPFLTPGEAAKVLGVCVQTIARYCDDGTLASQRTPGGHRRIPRAAVESLLRVEPAA